MGIEGEGGDGWRVLRNSIGWISVSVNELRRDESIKQEWVSWKEKHEQGQI